MYHYIIGQIVEYTKNGVALENNQIAYSIQVANPYVYKLKQEYKIYIYQHLREDESSLYGFSNIEEKNLFLRLISVKGLGCKMALPLMAAKTDELFLAIENGDIAYLKKFPKIGDKLARQILLDLKGKLINNGESQEDKEVEEVLLSLGYKKNVISKVINSIDKNKTVEEKVKEALKKMLV